MEKQWSSQETQPSLGEIYASECDEFAEALYLCAVVAARGLPVANRFVDFLRHRSQCPQCQETFQEVWLLLANEASQTAGEFPQADKMERLADFVEGWQNRLLQGSRWLVASTQRGAQLFIDLAFLAGAPARP